MNWKAFWNGFKRGLSFEDYPAMQVVVVTLGLFAFVLVVIPPFAKFFTWWVELWK